MSSPEEDSHGIYTPDQTPAQSPSVAEDDELMQRIKKDACARVTPITPEEIAPVKHLCKSQQQYDFVVALVSDHPMPPQEISEKVWEDNFSLVRFNAALATTRVILADTLLEVKNASLKGSPAQYYLGRKADETVINGTIVSPEGEILYTKAYIAMVADYDYADSYEFRRDFKRIMPEIGDKGRSFEGSGRRVGFDAETTYRIILALAAIKAKAASPEKIDIVQNTDSFARIPSPKDDEFFGVDIHPSGYVTKDDELTEAACVELEDRLSTIILGHEQAGILGNLEPPRLLLLTCLPKAKDITRAICAKAEECGGFDKLVVDVLRSGFQKRIAQRKLDPKRAMSILSDIEIIAAENLSKQPTRVPGSSKRDIFPEPDHSSELNLDSLPGLASSLKDPF